MEQQRKKLTLTSKVAVKKKAKRIWLKYALIIALSLCLIYILYNFFQRPEPANITNKNMQTSVDKSDTIELNAVIYPDIYLLNLNDFIVSVQLLDEPTGIESLLDSTNIHPNKKQQIAKLFDRHVVFPDGTKFITLFESTYPDIPAYLIIEPNPVKYFIINMKESIPSLNAYNRTLNKEFTIDSILIGSNPLLAFTKLNNPDLAAKVDAIMVWKKDISKLDSGDVIRIAYEQLNYKGHPLGVGQLFALKWTSDDSTFYAFQIPGRKDDKGNPVYCTDQGIPLRTTFRKSPVNYGRVSSRFNLFRKHPVKHVVVPHLGTDFAAPEGTPLLSIGDGIVEKREHTKNNGNYIIIKHNETYSSQYLHLSRFKSNVTKGTRVRQGEVIGYVGKTGLATGPHVCLRFWKNNKQIDFLAYKFPSESGVKPYEASTFMGNRDYYLNLLNK